MSVVLKILCIIKLPNGWKIIAITIVRIVSYVVAVIDEMKKSKVDSVVLEHDSQ